MDDTIAAIKYCHIFAIIAWLSFGSYTKKKYRYNGKEKDEESGLYYYAAKYYATWTLSFYSVAPKAPETVHQSSYCYADNNPIMFQDINGEKTPLLQSNCLISTKKIESLV